MRSSRLRLGPQLGSLVEYYLDIPQDRRGQRAGSIGPPAVHNETFSESNDLPFYIPPLTGALLHTLGTNTTLSAIERRRSSLQVEPRDASKAQDADWYSKVRIRNRSTRVAPLALPPDERDARAELLHASEPRESFSEAPRSGSSRGPDASPTHPVRQSSPEPERATRSKSVAQFALSPAPPRSAPRSMSGQFPHRYPDAPKTVPDKFDTSKNPRPSAYGRAVPSCDL